VQHPPVKPVVRDGPDLTAAVVLHTKPAVDTDDNTSKTKNLDMRKPLRDERIRGSRSRERGVTVMPRATDQQRSRFEPSTELRAKRTSSPKAHISQLQNSTRGGGPGEIHVSVSLS
jgi:hypothetical protein